MNISHFRVSVPAAVLAAMLACGGEALVAASQWKTVRTTPAKTILVDLNGIKPVEPELKKEAAKAVAAAAYRPRAMPRHTARESRCGPMHARPSPPARKPSGVTPASGAWSDG